MSAQPPTSTPASSDAATDPTADLADDRIHWWRVFRAASRWVRWPAYLAAGLVLLLVAVAILGVVLVRRPLPQTSGEATLHGLSASVEVIRDGHGIPQIYGDTDEDLMRAQGYVHAQERFFEMDLRRHVTAGRLSELFGEKSLATDKFIRTMGWRQVAEQEWALLSTDTRAALTAYSAGVNSYLAHHSGGSLAVEYSILRLTGLNYQPEEWTPIDSLAWLKAMAWDLRGNMEEEIDRVLLSVSHSEAEIAQLYPDYDYADHPPIVRRGGVVDGVFDQEATGNSRRNPRRTPVSRAALRALEGVKESAAGLPELVGRGEGIGSNSWVVDGEHSATGKPLLANDPHLGISQPGIWMQMGMHCRAITPQCTLDTAGFTFSGVPGVIIGHNSDIAWGFTNLGPDVTDLYLEKVQDTEWKQDGRWRPLKIRHETIKVRGGKDFDLRIRETAHGPLLSDVSAELATVGANAHATIDEAQSDEGGGDEAQQYAVALAWTALDPSPTADAIMQINRASNWTEFRAAAANFAVPAQNLIYADTAGHIGYQAPGWVPVRASGNDGTWPVEGWDSANDWGEDYIPFEALPSVLDPEEGFIVTANQAVIGADYPHLLTKDWDRGYRSTRIREVLAQEGELSIGEMKRLQLDTVNPMASVLVPRLLEIDDLPSTYYRDGQRLLADWDFTQPADSAAAAYYNVVWRELLTLTFHDDMRESVWPAGGDRWFQVVSNLLRKPAGPWWDDSTTEKVERRDDILRQAMMNARDELTRLRSLDPKGWSWGYLHTLDLRSSTFGRSGIAPVERLFNRIGYGIGGGSSIVNATGWDAIEGYEVSTAPSMRMVVSTADWDDSQWINLTGVSGHPGSSHYGDQIEMFVEGDYLPWAFSRDSVTDAGTETLLLKPGS